MSVTWPRDRRRSLWLGLGPLGRVRHLCRGNTPRRDREFLVRHLDISCLEDIKSIDDEMFLLARSSTVADRQERSWSAKTSHTLVSPERCGMGDLGSSSLRG